MVINTAQSQPPILWKQVLGLSAVQAAISLMWVIYGAYLPSLLEQFGMPPNLALGLLVVENGMAIALQPLMGGLSDRAQRWVGSRFPFIAVGIVLATVLFIAIPLTAVLSPTEALRRVVLFVLVSWALAMTVFHSPVLSLLGRYASLEQMPRAASLLTLASSLVGTTQPVVNQFILDLGPLTTFIVGAIALLGAATALRWLDPPNIPTALITEDTPAPAWRILLLIGGVGFAVGWGDGLMMDVLGRSVQAQLPHQNWEQMMFAASVGLALLALPMGFLATRWGNRRAFAVGLLGAIACVSLLVLLPVVAILWLGAIALIAALSLVLNGAIPFVLSLVPPARGGLAVGMYLGGIAAAVSVFTSIFKDPGAIPIGWGTGMGAIAFLIAAGLVILSTQIQPISNP